MTIGSPARAAISAPSPMASTKGGTVSPSEGRACTPVGEPPRNQPSSSRSCPAKSSASSLSRPSALRTPSVKPTERPRPMSTRPGNRDSRTPNCSATTRGRWLGSITPPVPTRIRSVALGHGRGQHRGRRSGDPGHAVMLRDPEPVVAQRFRLPRQPHGVPERLGAGVALARARAVEDGEAGRGDHGAHTGFNTAGPAGFPARRDALRGTARGADAGQSSGSSRPRRYAATRCRGTRRRTPSTVTGTSCGVLAFHWARRCRVLLRDIFRLGTAMGNLLGGLG